MIRVQNLTKHFDQVRAVDDISFNISRGEVVGLLGPNGAGKTTTMRVVTGYLSKDNGDVHIDGMSIDDSQIETRRRIGYLPENSPLYPDLEVTEYLGYISSLRGVDKLKRVGYMKEVVDTCGLKDVLGRPIGELSKGYRQRVGLAAAMIHKPAILILDEPTSGLDPNQIVEIRELIKEIGKERTVVLSTHILQEVEVTCRRAIIINCGKIVGQGTIEELLHRGGARAVYTITAKTSRDRIEKEVGQLGLNVNSWLSKPSEEKQRFTLTGNGEDKSETIFKWAVDKKITLLELKRETASLEDVFRELTQ